MQSGVGCPSSPGGRRAEVKTRLFALVRTRGMGEEERRHSFCHEKESQCPKKRRGPILRPTLFLLATVSCLTVQHQHRRDNEPYYCRNVREREPNIEFHSLAPSLRLCYYLYGVWRVVLRFHRPTSLLKRKRPIPLLSVWAFLQFYRGEIARCHDDNRRQFLNPHPKTTGRRGEAPRLLSMP